MHPSESPLDRPVRYLKGVGPKRAALLAALRIHTVRDLLLHLPRDYEDRRTACPIGRLQPGQKAVVSGVITDGRYRPTAGRRGIVELRLEDGTGRLTLKWFNAGRGWLSNFPLGATLTAYGTVTLYRGLQMVAPDYQVGAPAEQSDRFGGILPVYPLTEGLSQRMMRRIARAALELGAGDVPEPLPGALRRARPLPEAPQAVRDVHFPEDLDAARNARRRMAYEELLLFQIGLAIMRDRMRRAPGISFRVGPNVDRRIRRLFPFEFTPAQDRVIGELVADMRAPRPMNRLLQGDVGCGKTVVAVYAMLAALADARRGYQVALMAPTEILAEQHYLTLSSLLHRARVRTALLTGGAGASERRRTLSELAEGQIDLVVGTHALVQGDVRFSRLALVVVDEQHRFGVRHRLELRRKGPQPDVLIMTATPIPRTLALACFADMDISIIDQMPPGRKPVRTELCLPPEWPGAFEAARRELARGRNVFVIYPLVEENRRTDLTSAKEGYRRLSREVFPDYPCCLLHGQMSQKAKQEAMEGFRAGRYRVMAATTVVEVGIDVPQATVMIVQHAERLGLAQLHQLRGRIGRGEHPGTCFLLAEPKTEEARRRLDVLTATSDGFRIAEEDLRLRGPGQLFGTRQSGMPEFRFFDFADLELLRQARDDAAALVRADPTLTAPEHRLLRRRLIERYGDRLVFADVT